MIFTQSAFGIGGSITGKIQKLKDGDEIEIGRDACIVLGGITFSSAGYKWREWRLEKSGKEYWLSMILYGKKELALFEKKTPVEWDGRPKFEYNGIHYVRFEKSRCQIIECFGDVDVEQGQTCELHEYADKNRERFLSFEKWDKETEMSVGRPLPHSAVTVHQTL